MKGVTAPYRCLLRQLLFAAFLVGCQSGASPSASVTVSGVAGTDAVSPLPLAYTSKPESTRPQPTSIAKLQEASPQPPPPAPFLSTSSPAPLPTRTYPVQLETVACRAEDVPEVVTCYDLIVPEDRSQSQGRTVRLHTAVLKSRSPHRQPDPIVFLHGGPGGGALGLIFYNSEFLLEYFPDRDFIAFDQRGGGLSEPSLDCPEVDEVFFATLPLELPDTEKDARELEARQMCHDRLEREKQNLQAFTTVENAADVEDLRIALGFPQWNLVGVSYGARLALAVMRLFPQGIRSVVLDSVFPPQADGYEDLGLSVQAALQRVFDRCRMNSECGAKFPDLEAKFNDLYAQLNLEPVTITYTYDGRLQKAVLDGRRLAIITFVLLYDEESVIELPMMIHQAQHGNTLVLDRLFNRAISYLDPRRFSEGAYWSIECSGEIPFESLEDARIKNAGLWPPFQEYLDADTALSFQTCAKWGAGTVPPVENEPVVNELPALVLAGGYDPITPPEWGQETANNLPNSFYVEFPRLSHSTIFGDSLMDFRGCARSVVQSFLADPLSEPDSSCAAELTPVFITR